MLYSSKYSGFCGGDYIQRKGSELNKVECRDSRPLGEEVGEPEVDVAMVIERQMSPPKNIIITAACKSARVREPDR
jgi:hypothetical protein